MSQNLSSAAVVIGTLRANYNNRYAKADSINPAQTEPEKCSSHLQNPYYVCTQLIRMCAKFQFNSFLASRDFLSSADNLCKQFGPRSGLTECLF